MEAGVARVDITPPIGLELAGYAFGPAKGINDPLFVNVLILKSGSKKVVVVTADLLGLDTAIAEEIRTVIMKRTGASREFILIACSHTHSGPATMTLRRWGAIDESYVRNTVEKVATAATTANEALREARLGRGAGEARGIADNRVDKKAGYRFSEVGVLRVEDLDGRPLAVLYNFGCHPVAAHNDRNLISADYPGYAAKTIREKMGVEVSLFTLGAAGDINPAHFHHLRYAEQYGTLLGEKVVEVADSTECSEDNPELSAFSETISIPVEALPAQGELEKLKDEYESRLEELRNAEGTTYPKLMQAHIHLDWVTAALQLVESDTTRNYMPMEIQVLKLGEFVMTTMPCELFSEIGHRIREISPFSHTNVVTMANGVLCYIPTKQMAMEKKSYENTLAPRVYGVYTPAPEAEDVIVQSTGDLLRKTAKAEKLT